MMTRTSAGDLAARNVYMTCVDPGWYYLFLVTPFNIHPFDHLFSFFLLFSIY